MGKKKILLEDVVKVNPFQTPEGYFENFTDGIMSQLPDTFRKTSTNIHLWHRVRPWAYMAAMIAGVALMIKVFTVSPIERKIKSYASEGINLTSSSDIDDYYRYYDDGLAQLAYDDAFYETSCSE